MISLIFKYQVRICINIANTPNREANLRNEEKEALSNVLYELFLSTRNLFVIHLRRNFEYDKQREEVALLV